MTTKKIIMDQGVQSQAKSVEKIIEQKSKDSALKYNVEKEQEQMFNQFEKWTKQPMPKFLDAHKLKEGQAIIRVFGFRPENEKALFLTMDGSRTSDSLSHRTVSIAKILKAGEGFPYAEGSFVKLPDFKVSSIENPDYSLWINNEYSKSNLRKVGEEPPKFLNNIGRYYGPNMVILNPLKAKLEEDDYLTFKVYAAEIDYEIDVDVLTKDTV